MEIRALMFEDRKEHSGLICRMLTEWANKRGHVVQVKLYSSPLGFRETDLCDYDCIISDVKMPGQDGIAFARDIRRGNLSIPIIFISDYVEYGLSGYEVNALRFLNKNDPNFAEKLSECMDFTLGVVESNARDGYTVVNRGEHISIMFREIMYIEARDHTITFHTRDQSVTERKSLNMVIPLLPAQFCQCTRSHVVNVQYVVRFSGDTIKLRNGGELPLTKTFTADLMKAFAKYH